MAQVFISYSSIDRPAVERIVSTLKQRGWTVFWDGDIHPAENWHQKIAAELEAAQCTVVLWTRNSVRSFWVIEEAMYSRQNGVIVPVTLEDVSPPPGFLSLQCVDLSEWSGDLGDAGFQRLLGAITQHAGDPTAPAPDAQEMRLAQTTVADSATMASSVSVPPDAGSYVYEGESVPWFNWSALLMALLFTSFHGELLEISTTFFQRIIAGPQLHSLLITVAILLVLAACRPLVWDARKLNSKEVTAIFVLSSVVLFQLLALVFAKLDYRFGTLQAAESGQLVASVIVIALAVFVWLSRDYQKSWLEVGFLWLVVCVAAVVVSVYAALLYFGKAEVGLGRLYPRGTGLLIGSLLVILSAAAIFATKIRHMSPAEMAFFWMFGSLGLTVFVRILSIALYGRAYEIQTLSGTISGFVVSLVLGLVLLTRQVRARRRSAT